MGRDFFSSSKNSELDRDMGPFISCLNSSIALSVYMEEVGVASIILSLVVRLKCSATDWGSIYILSVPNSSSPCLF